MNTQFETFLLELAQALNFTTLAPDALGACLIMMKEGTIPLLFEFDDQLVPNTILISCPIAAIPISHRLDIYEALLKGNSLIENTLSVKPDEDMLYMHRRLHPEIQAKELKQILHFFLETVKLWKKNVEAILSMPPHNEQTLSHPASIKVFPFKV